MEWPEYLQTVQELRRECAGRNHLGALRPRSAVAWSLQRYLIFAILSSIPDRSEQALAPTLPPVPPPAGLPSGRLTAISSLLSLAASPTGHGSIERLPPTLLPLLTPLLLVTVYVQSSFAQLARV